MPGEWEYATLNEKPVSGFQVDLVNDTITDWKVTMTGQPDSPYAQGRFVIRVEFPSGYPFKPPKVRFETRIYHPNVDYESGVICVNAIRDEVWKPTVKMVDILQEIASLIATPNLDTPLIPSAAELYRSNPEAYFEKAKEWAAMYAQNS
ncbi:Ubiquitin-conjugating enzyme E2 4 [Dispira simplex]|nr:Ubiquitin-conjugating enzyme E2 4 [Dispira simplex]